LLIVYSASTNAQVDATTGNLINNGTAPTDTTSIWNNGVYVNTLCFQAGQAGNCGPKPSIRPDGVINYSYGTTDLNQIVSINKALSIGGSGVQLGGFNFGFTAKNGNGWDDGRQDYLGAYVKFYNSGGGLAANYDYTSQTNRKYNWTNFNFSETFSSPVPATSFSNAQVGFVGRDNNYWAGNYGPEIINVNFSLKYTVKPDPCINDPLSSPTCPGYALATVKNSILGSTVSNASATSFVPAMNYTSPAPAAAPPAVADAAPALAQASPQQQAQQPAQQAPAQQGLPTQQPGQDPNQNPAVAQDNPAQPSPQQAGPAPTQPQPAGGPPQVAQSAPPPSAGPSQAGPQQAGSATSGGGPSKLAMSVVKSAQAKEQAIQQSAVQNAAKAFENTQQSSQAASNLAISMNQDMSANSATAAAQFSSQNTQASQQTAIQTSQNTQQQQQTTTQQQQTSRVVQQVQQEVQQEVQQQSNGSVVQIQQAAYTPPQQAQQETQSTSVAMLKPTAPAATESQQQASSGTGLTVSRNPFAYNPLGSLNLSSISPAPTQTAPVYQPRLQERIMEVETPPMQVASFGGMGKAGNPLSEMMMQQRFELMQENIQSQTSTVNRNVQPNDLAAGVDLASMATQPRGFEAYSFVLRDTAFYEPKEVYKGQKVIDNVQVLRQMSSDSLHKRMVDMQYKQGE